MATPAAGGVLLLILLGIGLCAGVILAAVLLRRLHRTAQSEASAGRPEQAPAAHRKA